MYCHSLGVHISVLGVLHIADMLLREIRLIFRCIVVNVGGIIGCGPRSVIDPGTGKVPRSNAAIKSCACSSGVGSPVLMHIRIHICMFVHT